MKEWLEWITTTKAECPTCHTGTVRKVCEVRLAAMSHQHPGVGRIDSNEVGRRRALCWSRRRPVI